MTNVFLKYLVIVSILVLSAQNVFAGYSANNICSKIVIADADGTSLRELVDEVAKNGYVGSIEVLVNGLDSYFQDKINKYKLDLVGKVNDSISKRLFASFNSLESGIKLDDASIRKLTDGYNIVEEAKASASATAAGIEVIASLARFGSALEYLKAAVEEGQKIASDIQKAELAKKMFLQNELLSYYASDEKLVACKLNRTMISGIMWSDGYILSGSSIKAGKITLPPIASNKIEYPFEFYTEDALLVYENKDYYSSYARYPAITEIFSPENGSTLYANEEFNILLRTQKTLPGVTDINYLIAKKTDNGTETIEKGELSTVLDFSTKTTLWKTSINLKKSGEYIIKLSFIDGKSHKNYTQQNVTVKILQEKPAPKQPPTPPPPAPKPLPTPQPPPATPIALEKVKSNKSLVSVNETVTISSYLKNEADISKVKQMILVIDGKDNPMQHSTGKLWTYEWTTKPASNNGKITYSAYANGKDGTKGTVTLGETEITVNAPAGISSLTISSTKVPKGSGANFTGQLTEPLQNGETVWVSIDGINNQMNCTGKTCTFNVRAFDESGNRSFWGYVNDKAGKQLSKTSAVNFWVIPSALVTKVTPDKPSITAGGTATFTATVSGIVDIAKGEKVVVWLDNYQQDMKKSAGNTWTALVENISGVNGKRDYTARVQNDDAFSTEASHGTLTVKMPDTIKNVDAQKQGKPVSAFYLNDSIDFIVETKAVPKGDLCIMLNDFVHPEKLVRQGNSNLWKTTIFMGQEESKNYKACVKMNGSVVEESPVKTLNVNISKRQRDEVICPSSVKTGDLMEVLIKLGDPKFVPSNAKATTSLGSKGIGFIARTSEEWYFAQEIKPSHKGVLNISFDTSNGATIGSHYMCDVYVNMDSPPDTAPTPQPQSQSDIVSLLDFTPLSDGFMMWKVTVSKHPAGTLKVKLKFSQGGILTESMDYTNQPIVINLQQSGNEWSKKIKSSGKGILPYNIQYWIDGKLVGDSPGTFNPSPVPAPGPVPTPVPQKTNYCYSNENRSSPFMTAIDSSIKLMSEQIDMFSGTDNESLARTYYKKAVDIKKLYLEALDLYLGTCQNNYEAVGIFNDKLNQLSQVARHTFIEVKIVRADVRPSAITVGDNITFTVTTDTATKAVNLELPYPNNTGQFVYKVIPMEGSGSNWSKTIKFDLIGDGSSGIIGATTVTRGSVIMPSPRLDSVCKHCSSAPFNIFSYKNAINKRQFVDELYRSFQGAYNGKNESKIMTLISDDWESTGDGTTASDLSVNMRNSFRIFDQVNCSISNLQITPKDGGKFVTNYEIIIKGTIFKNNIRHEEKSSVTEEVTVDDSGKARITKTLNGRFWSVQ